MTEKVVQPDSGLDSFSDMTPVELPSHGGANNGKNESGLDTFDSQDIKDLDDADEAPKSEEKETEDKDIKRETDKLKDQEEDEEDSDDESESEEPEEESEQEEEKPEEKPKGKVIRLKDENGDSYDIPREATVPVKVKGKKVFVTLNELRENYSGKQVWSEKLQEADSKAYELESRLESFEKSKSQMVEHFGHIGQKIKKVFENNGEGADPLDAMKYLVDLSGHNVLEFEQKVLEHYGNLAMSFSEMSEAEQRLYWAERRNQILEDSQAAKARQSEERKAQEQRVQQIHQTMERYGISEEDFEATESHIESLGYDMEQVTPEQICKWAVYTPLVQQATELASQFEDDLSDDDMGALIQGTADAMHKYPEISPTEALKLSAKRIGYELYEEDEVIDQLKNRHKGGEDKLSDRKTAKYAEKYSESRGYESFDDFEDELYG